MKLHMLIPVAALALAACQSTEEALQEQGVQPLSGDEVQALVSGSTMSLDAGNGAWNGYFRPDGTSSGRGPDRRSDGTWNVNADGDYCNFWEISEWRGGCFAVYPEGDGYRLIGRERRSGDEFEVTFEPGNTQSL